MKKCKFCGERFELKFSTFEKYCQKIDCKTAMAMENLQKLKNKPTKTVERKAKSEAYKPEFKQKLQNEINKLSKMIDNRFGFYSCIDCDKPFGKQIDAGHFHSIGSNQTLRYNLHNIHSQKSDCNQNGIGGGKQLGYLRGLQKRYGNEYADLIEYGLQNNHKLIKLSSIEMNEKAIIVRKLIRDFDTFTFENAIQARDQMNKIIGIY